MWTLTVSVLVLLLAASAPAQHSYNDAAALNYQRQILAWQRAAARQPYNPYTSYSLPFAVRSYGQYRQEPGHLPPQPTIAAPVLLDTETPQPPAVQEVDNQLTGTNPPPPPPPPSGPQNPLQALCKAPRGQFPGTSCSKFVNCWDDFVVEQDCPSGLYFNPANNYCDFPFNVACSNPPTYVPDNPEGSDNSLGGSPGQAPPAAPAPPAGEVDLSSPGARCPTEFGTFRSTKNCGVFYLCVGFQPFEFTCPGGLNFHKDLQVCDYPYRVECNGVPSNQLPPETEPTAVPEGETTALAPPSEAAPPAPAAPTAEEVPAQLPPSPPTIVAPAPPSPESTVEAVYHLKKVPASLVDPGVTCQPGTFYRLTPSCSSVAVCRSGVTQVMNCGPGTAYDIYSQRCTSLLRARC